jgi:signal transduction histidine kinase
VRDGSDSIVGWFGTNTDVTEQREAQQSLLALTRTLEERVQRRTAELEESNAALEAFGYSVSHDLRAPLRTMQGFARALLEDYGPRLDDDGRDYATRITAGAARMDQLIQDLLAYSLLSRTEIKAEPVSLDAVLRLAERQLEPALLEHHGTLTIRSPLPRVLGHETTLVQVFVNLLSNALKFIAPGAMPEVEVWSERRAGRVRVFVRDNGIGIQPEHQERIFAVFERLHGSETYPGTGIGLAIVKKGIERLRGRSGVDSAPGRGSTFWIELPEPAPVAERTTWTYPES